MRDDFKSALIEEMKRVGAYDVGIADPHNGFKFALPHRHPLDIMPDCRSVVTFIIPRPVVLGSWYMALKRSRPEQPGSLEQRHLKPELAPAYNVYPVWMLLASFVLLRAVTFLNQRGYKAIDTLYKSKTEQLTPDKLCAYEAGLGVYGRSGLIIHPELGNRIGIAVILTDAELESDSRLEGFDPCRDCRACITACPAEAYGVDGSYHTSWSQEKCESKSREPNGGAFRCGLGGRCWEICPAGKYSDEELFLMDSRSRRCLEILSNIFSSIAANFKQ